MGAFLGYAEVLNSILKTSSDSTIRCRVLSDQFAFAETADELYIFFFDVFHFLKNNIAVGPAEPVENLGVYSVREKGR